MAEVVGLFRVGREVVEFFAAVSPADVDLPLIGQGSRRPRSGERLALVIDDLGQDQIVESGGGLGSGLPVTGEASGRGTANPSSSRRGRRSSRADCEASRVRRRSGRRAYDRGRQSGVGRE